jgi:hypothetical protein
LRKRPNRALHLSGVAILVPRGMKALQAAPAGEVVVRQEPIVFAETVVLDTGKK